MKTKPFEKVTVSDVQKASTVSRATFYRHFDCMTDVLRMKCDQCFHDVLSGYIEKNSTGGRYGLLLHYFGYWCQNSTILEMLLSINRMDIIYDSHLKNSEIITNRFLPDVDTSSEEYIYFMALRTGLTVGYLTAWVRTGKKKTPEELVRMLFKHLKMATESNTVL